VTIRNSRDEPIYIKTEPQSGMPPFRLSDESGQLFWAPDYTCEIVTCARMMEGVCLGDCMDCYCGEAIVMASGATYEMTWPGALYEATELPSECNVENCEWGLDCAEPYQGPEGAYTLSSVAHTALDCQGMCTECDPGDGWCIMDIDDDSFYAGEELQAGAEVDYPTATAVAITFE